MACLDSMLPFIGGALVGIKYLLSCGCSTNEDQIFLKRIPQTGIVETLEVKYLHF